jgi:hypothetical protein
MCLLLVKEQGTISHIKMIRKVSFGNDFCIALAYWI